MPVTTDGASYLDERQVLGVGGIAEYKSIGSAGPVPCRIVSISAFAPARGDYIKADWVYEYAPGDDIDLVCFGVKDKRGNEHWGYWNQVTLP